MVTSRVSGMSTMTKSSTPRQAMRRPEPGTTIPPATCSVRTIIGGVNKYYNGTLLKELTQIAVAKDTRLIGLRGNEVSEGREITDIVPTWILFIKMGRNHCYLSIFTKGSRDNGNTTFRCGWLSNRIVNGNLLQSRPNFA